MEQILLAVKAYASIVVEIFKLEISKLDKLKILA